MPLISAVAITPVRYGSSEKYSKFRPHRGLRLMFTAGPSSTLSFSCWQASPRASPIFSISSGSKEAAVALAAGKQTALMLSLIPRWSAWSSCFRRPCGPSLTMLRGTPRRSTGLVCQKSSPDRSPAFSSSVILAIRFLMSLISICHLKTIVMPSAADPPCSGPTARGSSERPRSGASYRVPPAPA